MRALQGVKTQEEFDLFGGLIGASFDECYHQVNTVRLSSRDTRLTALRRHHQHRC